MQTNDYVRKGDSVFVVFPANETCYATAAGMWHAASLQEEVAVLWFPPFKIDITDYVKAGTNSLKISVTNTWANRLTGDEQYPADFEWGTDRGEEGRAMKAFPLMPSR